ncbi:c-type cytochrome biogenesis protein CcmI [Pseudooceanicola algae]|uniref:Uncharacterized protein n=1 Tax=Pseudooceanicola algae TaxID=1537215 RepID=A0A418SC62_9RHOB|nr:c-type cytochrome biogenesis protein CcmI [Pseudooceanicola algae]QPM89995.1 hypothetical protein PSAL_012260 [Pseudooceanicola algae]
MFFWITCSALALGVAAVLARTMMTRTAPGPDSPASFDLQIYRDQLAEVDRDLARGVLPESEAGRLRTEISRRILTADSADRTPATIATARGPGRWAALAGSGAVLALAVGLYAWLGVPGQPDLPRAQRIATAKGLLDSRPSQAEAEAAIGGAMTYAPAVEVSEDFETLMTRLRSALAERPDDEQGLRLLARNEAALGNFQAAYDAQRRLLAVAGTRATAQDHADHADMLILSAGGTISAEAAEALQAALRLDPGNGAATYYSGLLMAQTDRPDIAFNLWNRLLRTSPTDAPWMAPLRAQLPQVARMAGESRFEMPAPPASALTDPSLPGPSAGDIAAAQDMSAQDQQDMIRGMVDGLASRLASDGGVASEWARLIAALGVLGETDRARAIYQEAEQTFAGNPGDLAVIARAGQQAGLDQ